MWKKVFIFLTLLIFWTVGYSALKTTNSAKPENSTSENYTLISADVYHQVVKQSEKDIQRLTALLKPYQGQPNYVDHLVSLSTKYFMNRPYCAAGIEGEGDWCPGDISRHGCSHLQQDPIYRTDAFVCNTFVQTVLALVDAKNSDDFNHNILRIRYGAAHEPSSSIHYYNRNNFISADFNPVNEKNGLLRDATREGVFAPYVKQTSAIIDRQEWFRHQMQPATIKNTVHVLSEKNGSAMVQRAQQNYPEPFHHFLPEKVTIDYIPKEILTQKIKSKDSHVGYEANEKFINQLPTPSVIEIVRDVHQWKVGGKPITEVIGSGINVSHLGLIYRQHFKQGEIIYQNIRCTNVNEKKVCTVSPVICHQRGGCTKIMFAHATEAYPNGYYYYCDSHHHYHCDATPPKGVSAVACNRVISMPLGDYLTTYRYGKYAYLDEPSFLGIHVEKIRD